MRFGDYAPENFDLTFQGTVTVRARAADVAQRAGGRGARRVGASRLTARLAQAGGALVLPKGEAPGLAMGLGGVGVTLTDLVDALCRARAAGTRCRCAERDSRDRAVAPRRLLDPVAAWYVGNILIGTPPPENAAPRPHRLQDRHLLRLSRRLGGRLRRPHDHRRLGRPAGWRAGARALTGACRRRRSCSMRSRAPAACRRRCRRAQGRGLCRDRQAAAAAAALLPDGAPATAPEPPRIMFPPDGARLELAKGGKPDPVALKIAGGVGPLTVLVNGVPLPPQGGRRTLFFEPDGPGFVRLTVMDASGATDSVMVRLQ